MPNMNGVEFTQWLRNTPSLCRRAGDHHHLPGRSVDQVPGARGRCDRFPHQADRSSRMPRPLQKSAQACASSSRSFVTARGGWRRRSARRRANSSCAKGRPCCDWPRPENTATVTPTDMSCEWPTRRASLPRPWERTRIYCDIIEQAAPMHDIGKIGVPDSILLKRGELDAARTLDHDGACPYRLRDPARQSVQVPPVRCDHRLVPPRKIQWRGLSARTEGRTTFRWRHASSRSLMCSMRCCRSAPTSRPGRWSGRWT